MNRQPKKHRFGVGVGALLLATTSMTIAAFTGCSGDDNGNPMPTKDSGTDSSFQHDTSTSGDSARNDVVTTDTSTTDTSLPDVGSCTSDSSSCNSCYDDAQAAKDPLNACSPYAKNCVPFTTKVPSHPTL